MTEQYLVILEADGEKPSSTFYEKRARLALKVRGASLDPSLTPVARRTRNGVELASIIQEGAIITPSRSQAVLIAELAREHGIKVVYFGTANITPYESSAADKAAFDKIQGILSKKGRKPEPEVFTVTCYEEMLTYELTASEVFLCPACHGTNIQTRNGHARRVRPPQAGENLAAYWLWSRFPHGKFEIPLTDDEAPDPSYGAVNDLEDLVVRMLGGSLGEIVAGRVPLSEKGKLDLLDAAYITRSYWPQETRDQVRAEALIMWVREFQGTMDFPYIETPVPDVIDSSGLIGTRRALNIYKAYIQSKNN